MVGGGCRGLDLARELIADGHAVRAVTRRTGARAAIEDAGAECWIGDPDVVGTLRYALDNVTVLLWLLGTARGPDDEVAPLHGSRLPSVQTVPVGSLLLRCSPTLESLLLPNLAESPFGFTIAWLARSSSSRLFMNSPISRSVSPTGRALITTRCAHAAKITTRPYALWLTNGSEFCSDVGRIANPITTKNICRLCGGAGHCC